MSLRYKSTGNHSIPVRFIFLPSVIPEWRLCEFMSWEYN